MNFTSGRNWLSLPGTIYVVVVVDKRIDGVFKTLAAAKKLKSRIPTETQPEIRVGHFEADGSITTI